ncbi:hypothetical protein [Variovorax sp. AFSI2.2]|uniref:hypothetical protein n=1 Tax=Variovorax sp. AFSI2.2 TaxID=3384160 RepID=UPI003EC0C94B
MLELLPQRTGGREATINGYAVPRIEVLEDPATGHWRITYDRRFAIVAESLEELQRWLWIVANAQAVGEGYSCHGENSVFRPNPHQRRVMQIGSIEAAPMGTLED